MTTALLSGPFLKRPLPRRHSRWRGGQTEEILFLKHELRNFVGGGVFLLDTLFLAAPGVGVDIQRTTRHICCRRDIFCLFGFVTSYIMQNYFCTNCLKVIYARFECIPVFLLFWDCQLPWFPKVGENWTCTSSTQIIHLYTCPDLAEQAKTFQLKACLTGSWEPALYVVKNYTSMWIYVNYSRSKTLCQVSSV